MNLVVQLKMCLFVIWLCATWLCVTTVGKPPQIMDDRFELSLFAQDPEIVTPIGMAIDDLNRIFVIESHTHHPPKDYSGPKGDRIKVFWDKDDDGKADSVTVFADGLHQTMNLALSPDGTLYAVCAREVLRLEDTNGDGKCDRKSQVLKLSTQERYAHNSLLGITFDRDGWMYVARGNTGSNHYLIEGKDSTKVEGYGDGGSVIRCRANGTEVSEFATGFWNPFDLKFDSFGRLFLVDNDPDARGPNRLLSIVEGGDYGYKSIFGGSGTHPFQGWDGEFPGTLPFIAGTGEAPSGLIDCRRTGFPTEFEDSLLVTIWNENSIERFELESGQTLRRKSVFVQGDQDFRPVAMDCDRRGNLFFTDWVLVDYPNHGRGRIWRVSPRKGHRELKPRGYFDDVLENPLPTVTDSSAESLESLLRETLKRDRGTDPMERHAAVMRLARDDAQLLRKKFRDDKDDRLRLASLLASRRSDSNEKHSIRRFLGDSNVEVRCAALLWASETMDLSLRDALVKSIESHPVTPEVFECFLAAHEVLSPDFVEGFRTRSFGKANRIPRKLDGEFLANLAFNSQLSSAARVLAIERFDQATIQTHSDALSEKLRASEDDVTIAAMRALGKLEQVEASFLASVLAIANDQNRSALVRTHALSLLDNLGKVNDSDLPIADSDPQVAVQAERILRARNQGTLQVQDRPKTKQAWRDALSHVGDPLLGRHVFFSRRVGCSRCHQAGRRGGTLGPGLDGIAKSKSRGQIIDAILEPSSDFPPQYQAWNVLTTDGQIFRGLQLDHKAAGAIVLTLDDGSNRYFKAEAIESYEASGKSLMPDGLEATMSVEEFRDLIAFIESMGR